MHKRNKTLVKIKKTQLIFFRIIILIALLCSVVVAVFAFFVDKNVSEVLNTISTNKAKNVATQAINDSVSAVIDSDKKNYETLVEYSYDSEGNIIAVNTNINQTNAIEGAILDSVVQRIDSASRCPVSVPIGTLIGSDLLIGRGPAITFYISLSANARSGIENIFESTGINQSRHQIQVKIEVDISILLSGKHMKTSVENIIIIGETIIVGQIPESYVKQP